jgi:AAA15 family ATPase/GTPase
MLIQFNYENFKSFLSPASLDFTASNISELKDTLIPYEKENYLRVISIYGANASGKSNVIESFNFMRNWVLNSFKLSSDQNPIPIKKFRFCTTGKESPSLFEVFVLADGTEYQYGFEVNDDEVLSEWLYRKNIETKRFNFVFERSQQTFKLDKNLKSKKLIIESINKKSLLISFLASLNEENISEVFTWFYDAKVINFGSSSSELFHNTRFPADDVKDPEKYKKFMSFLTAFDLGIQGIRVEMLEGSHSELDDEKRFRVFTQHRNTDTDELEDLLLSEESSGTQKMISLYVYLTNVLNNGTVLFVDELDAKLHPNLTRYLISMFQSPLANPNHGQLIFTAHDTQFMSREMLRRDQIWFVEKKRNGSSELYPLSEYKLNENKIRKDASYTKDYLGGRYGAVPNLREDATEYLLAEKLQGDPHEK